MTKELALRPQYAQYLNPNPKPELFGRTRPEVKKPYWSWPAYNLFFFPTFGIDHHRALEIGPSTAPKAHCV